MLPSDFDAPAVASTGQTSPATALAGRLLAVPGEQASIEGWSAAMRDLAASVGCVNPTGKCGHSTGSKQARTAGVVAPISDRPVKTDAALG